MRYDYEDALIAERDDGSGNAASMPCAVVGITRVENEDQSRLFKAAIGTTLYTGKFGDGSDALPPEAEPEPLPG